MKQAISSSSIDIISILREYKNIIAQQLGENLISVTLYGSYARGDYNEDSDVDVLLVLNEPATTIERQIIYSTLSDIEAKYDNIFLTVIVVNEDDYLRIQSLNTLFYQNIVREGKAI